MSSYDTNFYYHPDKSGLIPVGEIEWDHESYQFNITCLWHHPETERFFMASDTGCSCPTPFEGFNTLEQLEHVVSLNNLKSFLTGVVNEKCARREEYKTYSNNDFNEAALRTAVRDLLSKAREMGLRT